MIEAPAASAPDAVAPLAADGGTDLAERLGSVPSGRLVVQVIWASDRTPAAGVGLVAICWSGPDPLFSRSEGLTDAAGRWEVSDLVPGKVTVYPDRANGASTDVRAGERAELALEIPAGIQVRGLVVDPDEHPVAGAAITLSQGRDEAWVAAHSDAGGRFTLRDVSSQRRVGAEADGHMPSQLISVVEDGTHEADVTLRLGAVGVQLAGRVTDAQNQPVAGALVQVGPEQGWPVPDSANRVLVSGQPARRLRTDARGAFASHDLPPGDTPLAVRARGHSPWLDQVGLRAGESATVEVVLPESAVVSGVVSGLDGRPVAGASISAGSYGDMEWVTTTSDHDGRYSLADLPLGDRELSAGLKGGGKDATQLTVVAGARLAWDPHLNLGLQIVGRVVDATGAPVPGQHVTALAYLPGKTVTAQGDTDQQGHFTLSNCADAEHELTVNTPDWRTVLVRQKSVRPGPDEVVLQIVPPSVPSAWIVGRLLDDAGHVPELATVGAAEAATGILREPRAPDAKTGDFRVGPLAPGEWDFYLIVGGHPPSKGRHCTLAPDETLDVGSIVLATPGRIILHVTLPPGAQAGNVMCGAKPKEHSWPTMLKPMDGEPDSWISDYVDPGDYEVYVGGGSGDADTVFIVAQTVAAHVEGGADTRLEVLAERGTAQSIELHTERESPPPTNVLVLGPDGSDVVDNGIRWYDMDGDGRDDDGYVSFVGLPGEYTLRVTSEGKVVEERSFSLSASVNIAPGIEVNLP
ncbi:MAG TPA: carboxypeptidase-like regulatory domain-containing protein [Planctomycetota bacterium]|nr:carboxypeptidase-like regulatory domain-containing protein [Planctomycetota bacterium]